jgi:hypothetical protein
VSAVRNVSDAVRKVSCEVGGGSAEARFGGNERLIHSPLGGGGSLQSRINDRKQLRKAKKMKGSKNSTTYTDHICSEGTLHRTHTTTTTRTPHACVCAHTHTRERIGEIKEGEK